MNDDFFKDDRNFMSPAEAKSADTPKLLIVIRLVLLAYGLGWFIYEFFFFGPGLAVFLMGLGKPYEFLLLLVPLLIGLPFLVAVSAVSMKQKEVWIIILILSIFALVSVFLDSIVVKLAGISTAVILLVCLLTKQVRSYYFGNQLRSRTVILILFFIIGLILFPILLTGSIYLKSYTKSHDEYLSYLIDKMGIESAVSAEGNGIIGQWYDIHNRLPESIDEFIFSAPNPETIEIDGITYGYFYFTSEEKERLKVFLKNKELTYQRNGEKSYTICGVFKARHIFGEKDDLNNNTNPYYHERGLKCIRKSIEE